MDVAAFAALGTQLNEKFFDGFRECEKGIKGGIKQLKLPSRGRPALDDVRIDWVNSGSFRKFYTVYRGAENYYTKNCEELVCYDISADAIVNEYDSEHYWTYREREIRLRRYEMLLEAIRGLVNEGSRRRK